MDATQRDCYRLVGGRYRLEDQYIRMASGLYTKTWCEVEFANRSKRILLDPTYAKRLMLESKDYLALATKFGKAVQLFNFDHVCMVFMPVLEVAEKDKHWVVSCRLAVDLKAKNLWIIDSLNKEPFDKHSEVIVELWELSELCNWNRRVFEVQQTNTFSCGVLMLGCIKHCARRFDFAFSVDKNLRVNLFLQDAYNDFNYLKAKLEDILPKERRGSRRTNS